MSFVSERERRQVMEECFSGHMSRDCVNCPAHPDNGGSCCFGNPEKFSDDDKECEDCIHHDECQQEVINKMAEEQWREQGRHSSIAAPRRIVRLPVVQSDPRRITVQTTRVPSRFTHQVARLEKPRASLIRPPTTTVQIRTAIPAKVEPEKPTKEETLLHRFLKDFIWGGLQGAFEMATDFFRNHRLP
jgi:hypothetical protein